EGALRRYAGHEAGWRLETGDRNWVAHGPGARKVILVRSLDENAPDPAEAGEAVVWRYRGRGKTSGSVFEFSRLQAHGPWDAFADRVAAFLCDHVGAHFVFSERSDA